MSNKVYVADGAKIIGNVSISEGSSVWYNAVIRGDEAEIKIGKNSNIQDCCVLSRGEYITKKDSVPGDIPVILGGQEPAYYIDRYNHTGKAIVISRSGASAGQRKHYGK